MKYKSFCAKLPLLSLGVVPLRGISLGYSVMLPGPQDDSGPHGLDPAREKLQDGESSVETFWHRRIKILSAAPQQYKDESFPCRQSSHRMVVLTPVPSRYPH